MHSLCRRTPDDDLADVIELVPILIACVHVPEQGLKLGPTRDAHVEALGSHKGRRLKQVEVVPGGGTAHSKLHQGKSTTAQIKKISRGRRDESWRHKAYQTAKSPHQMTPLALNDAARLVC